jgi:capsular exopolysaccharide synthesis family protein
VDDIRRQVVIAVRWLPLVLIGALAAGAAAFAFTSGQPKVYEATARLIVDPGPSPTTQDLAVAQEQVALYAGLAESRPLAGAVAKRLKLAESPDDILERVSTSVDAESLSLAVNVRDRDPGAALVLAEALGDELRQEVRDRLITDEVRDADRAIKANQAAINFSQRRLNTLIGKPNKNLQDRLDIQDLFSQVSSLQSDILLLQQSSSAFVRNRLDWFEAPSGPESPVEPRPTFWAMLAAVVGGMLGLAIGFVLEYLNGKIRDERDLEAATGSSVLGTILEKRGDIGKGDPERLIVLRHPYSQEADAYRSLRARISLASGPARTLLVAAADPSDGQSAVAANLAVAYAEAGHTVILIDADLRSPSLHSFFGVPNERGLSVLLTGNEVPLNFVTMPTPHPRLRLMPAGPASVEASELLVSPQVPRVLGRLLQVADMVVVHGPSMTANLDAAMLATYLQASILVVPKGVRMGTVADAARALQSDDARYSGAVLYGTARGSHGRTAPRPALSLPAPRIAQASTPSGSSVSQQQSSPEPSRTEHQPGGAYLLVSLLYRIVRGPQARPVAEPETRAVNGRSAPTGPPGSGTVGPNTGSRSSGPGTPAGPTTLPAVPASTSISAGPMRNGQGAPAAPWPNQPRPAIAVPVEPPAVASAPQAGPYAGEFRPGVSDD